MLTLLTIFTNHTTVKNKNLRLDTASPIREVTMENTAIELWGYLPVTPLPAHG